MRRREKERESTVLSNPFNQQMHMASKMDREERDLKEGEKERIKKGERVSE